MRLTAQDVSDGKGHLVVAPLKPCQCPIRVAHGHCEEASHVLRSLRLRWTMSNEVVANLELGMRRSHAQVDCPFHVRLCNS